MIDNALSIKLAEGLGSLGHDAVHVRSLGLASAPDEAILSRARSDHRIVVTADSDFGMHLAAQSASGPSVILFRKGTQRSALAIRSILESRLGELEADLARGAVVTIEPGRYRVRLLPIDRPIS